MWATHFEIFGSSLLYLPDLIARELWQPMGAEADAEITVDGHGNPMADGGISCTLRDLARFGLLLHRQGRRGESRVIPSAWIEDTLTPDEDTVAAFEGSLDAREFPRGSNAVIPKQLAFGGDRLDVLTDRTIRVYDDARTFSREEYLPAQTNAFAVQTWKGLVDLAEQVAAV